MFDCLDTCPLCVYMPNLSLSEGTEVFMGWLHCEREQLFLLAIDTQKTLTNCTELPPVSPSLLLMASAVTPDL